MKKVINFLLNLQFIFRPSYWVMNYRYSKEWDELLNLLMEKEKPVFERINGLDGKIYNVSFLDIMVWVGNYPYAYATPSPTDTKYRGEKRFRPSRLTILKFHNFIEPLKRESKHGFSFNE